jgi:iron complex outermembrane receptor protein
MLSKERKVMKQNVDFYAKLMRARLLRFVTSALALALLGQTSSSLAESESQNYAAIEEVIVTAQKREEGVQEVPLAVSAYSGQFLEDRQIRNLEDLSDFSPSFNFNAGGTLRNSYVAVRGIGSSGQNAGIDGSVGLYLDGVFIPRQSGLIGSLSDVSAVEVLKGPQGTLYGANTPAGLVNVTTADPTQEFSGSLQVGAGNHGSQETSGFVTGGLTDNLAARATFWQRSNDGYTKLKTGGRANSREDWGMRLKTLWTPSDSTIVEFAADYSDIVAYCCVGEWIDISDEALTTFDRMAEGLLLNRDLIFPNREGDGYLGRGEILDHVSYSQKQAMDDIEHWGLSVKVSQEVMDGHELSLVASYRDYDSNQHQDQDTVGIDVTVWADQPETHETTSVEVNFSSPTGNRYNYLLGLFYFEDDGFFWQQSQLVAPGCSFTRNVQNRVNAGTLQDTLADRLRCAGHGRSDQWDQTHESLAVFAQGTYEITDQWSVTLGARLTRDDKSVDKRVRLFSPETEANYAVYDLNCPLCSFAEGNPTANNLGLLFGTAGFQDQIDNEQTTYSISTQYTLEDVGAADDILLYARYATGYKAPGINARPIRFPTIPTNYDEETSDNLEFGFKSTWLDRRLLANVAIFMNDFEDLQQIASNPASDPTGAIGTFVQNAGTLENRGIELEYIYQPTANLNLSGSIAYLDSEYAEFPAAPCPNIGNIPKDATITNLCDYSGFENVASPELRSVQTLRYGAPTPRANVDWYAQASWIYTDDHYVTSDLDERGLQKAYSIINASLGLEAADGSWNLSIYGRNLSDKIYVTGLINGAVPGLFGNRGSKVVRLGEPLTFGARLTVNFD